MSKEVRKAPPEKCDVCKRPILLAFVDGKTIRGPWADMCVLCHQAFGRGLGTGRGQRYESRHAWDGEELTWVKVAG